MSADEFPAGGVTERKVFAVEPLRLLQIDARGAVAAQQQPSAAPVRGQRRPAQGLAGEYQLLQVQSRLIGSLLVPAQPGAGTVAADEFQLQREFFGGVGSAPSAAEQAGAVAHSHQREFG